MLGNPEILRGVAIRHEEDVGLGGGDDLLDEGGMARVRRASKAARDLECGMTLLQHGGGLLGYAGGRP